METTTLLAGDLARVVLATQLEAMLAQPNDMEGIHQRRVATRRMRAALRVFRGFVPDEGEQLREELAWLGRALGAVRDLDVQMAVIQDMAGDEDIGPIMRVFAARRLNAVTALDLVLASPRYERLIAGLRALETCAWPESSGAPARAAAPPLIREREKGFIKAARRARRTAPAPKLHKARIRAKQLRYTLEFFSNVYGKPATALIRRMVRIQDVLGTVQDMATLEETLAQMHDDVDAPSIAILVLAADERMRAARTAIGSALRSVRRGRRKGKQRWKRLDRALAYDDSTETETSVSGVATATVP